MTLATNNCVRFLTALILIGVLVLPNLAFASGYISLVGIQGLSNISGTNMQTYVNTLYRIAIIAAALVAVIKLILAGAQYVLSGIVTDKAQAKKDIRSALIGLLIIIAAVTILTTINPSITQLPALDPISVPPPAFVPPDDGCAKYEVNNGIRTCVISKDDISRDVDRTGNPDEEKLAKLYAGEYILYSSEVTRIYTEGGDPFALVDEERDRLNEEKCDGTGIRRVGGSASVNDPGVYAKYVFYCSLLPEER